MRVFTVPYESSVNSLKKIGTRSRTSLVKKSESTHSYWLAYAHGGLYEGVYTRSNTRVKEKVGLSAGGAYTWSLLAENTVHSQRTVKLVSVVLIHFGPTK